MTFKYPGYRNWNKMLKFNVFRQDTHALRYTSNYQTRSRQHKIGSLNTTNLIKSKRNEKVLL